jgi:hypothetical protein
MDAFEQLSNEQIATSAYISLLHDLIHEMRFETVKIIDLYGRATILMEHTEEEVRSSWDTGEPLSGG